MRKIITNIYNKTGPVFLLAILSIILVFTLVLVVNNAKHNYEIEQIEKQMQQETAVLKEPAMKLEAYSHTRTTYKDRIAEIKEERAILDSNEKLALEFLERSEKQIRCQRAFVVGMEEGNCDDKETYEAYSL